MNFCLSDLVPPLRWSDAATILAGRAGLPDAWWRSLPMGRVLPAFGVDALSELLTDLTLEQWPAAAVGDVLPALHVLDPDDADDPQVGIALDRAGSWPGLLALTGRELTEQPFVKARPLLAALYSAVLSKLAATEVPSRTPVEPEPEDPEPEEPYETRAALKTPFRAPFETKARAEEPEDDATQPPVVPQPRLTGEDDDPDFPDVIDRVFASLDDHSWMVAQNRVFTDSPTSPESLSKLLGVPASLIEVTENTLRARLKEWLASPPAARYRGYLLNLTDLLGVAAPKSRLVNAAEWHTRELASLDVLAWQFVLATLPGYQVSGDWVVQGDLAELHERTRGLIVNAERPPTVSRALELVSSLGIHPEVAKEWLENVPQLRIQSPNGAAPAPAAPPAPPAPPRPSDVSQTQRCFRQPDGRWWLRVDVDAGHLAGTSVGLPEGFALYLGLSPGGERTVRSAAGDVTMTWRESPAIDSLGRILSEVAAKEGSHIFLTLSDEGMLRVRHLPAANSGDTIARALRLVGYTAPGGNSDQADRVIATRIGLTGPTPPDELRARLRERGDRDLLSLLG
ncbi:hypothetical protein FDA94_25265 [Herbidospora galbida]|uniref:Uncharacterized protein n=1 Tax=Herbidospora galbida TaxID=2575442 RepID=A0A4U3MBF9_9ACTN|nr:hypothetical protein [Herbidospora galbida]TKK85454.1 hypothetical protein FDA94_25265 [Herbidospora galbida]